MDERRIRVFVSATDDLEPEREVVGEVLARFPAPLPWEIKRTPHSGEQNPAELENVRHADLCLVLLGRDITAPVGAEVDTALESGIGLLAFVKDTAHTPAAQFFRHSSDVHWQGFSSVAELRQSLVKQLVQALPEPPLAYRLLPEELVALDAYLRKREKGEKSEEPHAVVDGHQTAGAENAAVIVAPSRRRR